MVLLGLVSLALLGFVDAGANIRGNHQLVLEEIQQSLQDSMQEVLRGGSWSKLEKIEQSIWQTYQSLPKNEFGHIGPRAVRYLVHNYFAKEHGWLIKGLEPHGHQADMSQVHEVNILQDKAPALVESLLEAQRKGRGLALADAVAMLATLERLIFEEAVILLQAAYRLNSIAPVEQVDERAMHEVLSSYLVLFEMGQKADLNNTDLHRALKARAAEVSSNWPLLVEFEQDSLHNYVYANKDTRNPFVGEELFDFEDAVTIVEGMAHGYGKWQNTECQQMKHELMDLDSEGNGLVPLGRFYSQPENAEYHFTETREYLRQIGALQESGTGDLHVRIANYMTGPSNCIASSSYYSVCCLNECEGLMNELEAKVLAPTTTAHRLLDLVVNMSSANVDAPRQIPSALEQKLHLIAKQNDGQVPLHGRLFAQWMHYAYPHECPYPQIAEDAAVLTPSHWQDKKTVVSKAERVQLAEVHTAVQVVEEEETLLTWNETEVLAAYDAPERKSFNGVRLFAQLGLLAALLRAALGATASLLPRGCGKCNAAELPF
mmetsp:Transcript_19970/g.28157  ORF Transcript_19970/g.28157 Transcript_19970/m.28157 type:complete len:546 (+) Transcript_19970:73-1710(+)